MKHHTPPPDPAELAEEIRQVLKGRAQWTDAHLAHHRHLEATRRRRRDQVNQNIYLLDGKLDHQVHQLQDQIKALEARVRTLEGRGG